MDLKRIIKLNNSLHVDVDGEDTVHAGTDHWQAKRDKMPLSC
jgi:hypothetical protein